MYKLSRLLLIVALLACCYSIAAVFTAFWPVSGFIVVFGGLAYAKKGRRPRLTSLGTARWANRDDLHNAGMLDSDSGLVLGHLLGDDRSCWLDSVVGLLSLRLTAQEACRDFRAAYHRKQRPLVRLPKAIHTAVFSPSGGGKGVSCVIPFLLNCRESCVVVDFKGENAKVTAAYRDGVLGHKTVMLDPYREATQYPDCFNPLSFIDKDHPEAIDDCNDLAKALVIRAGEEKEPHWNDAAELWIAAVIIVVVFYGDAKEGTRSLQTVRDILSNPQKLELAIKVMLDSKACGGVLARIGGQLTHFIDKEKSSVLTTVSRHLRFLDTPAVTDSTRTSSFDPSALRSGKMTVYLILPPNHMRAQSPLLRMWTWSMLRAVVQGGLQERDKTHFILDEAASLGHLEAIDDAVDKYRGYGIRLQFYYQSLGQLKKTFPDGQDQTLLTNTTQIFFGVNDQGLPGGVGTADYISARLGEKTIAVHSDGSSCGRSRQWSSGSNQQSSSGGWSSNESHNFQPQARKLLKPEEVIALSSRAAITFTPGVPPICTSLVRYYEEPDIGTSASVWQKMWTASTTLILAIFLCASSLGIATRITERIVLAPSERSAGSTDGPTAPNNATPSDVPVE